VSTIGGEVVVEPPSAIGIIAFLMSTKSQVLSMSFCTPGRVDVEPPSVANSLHECASVSPRAWQAAVDDVEDEVVEIFFPPSCLLQSGNSALVEFFSELSVAFS
jgi:hypothetical protein